MPRRRPLMRIGQEFPHPGTGERWRVTDVGTRTFAAINLDDARKGETFSGPPYGVREHVWDEYDFAALAEVDGIEWAEDEPGPDLDWWRRTANERSAEIARLTAQLAERDRLLAEASKRIAAVRRVLDQASPKFRQTSTWIDLDRALRDAEPQAAAGTGTPLEALIAAARKVAAFWQVHGQLDSVQLAPLVDACKGLDEAVLNSAEFRRWNAGFMGEPLICPACGADYAEAEAKNQRLAWRNADGQAVAPFTPGAVAFPPLKKDP